MTGTRGVVIERIDLADIRGDWMERAIGRNHLRSHALLAVPVGRSWNAAEETGVVVGGGAKHITGRVEPQSPGVVIKLMHELEG